MNVSIKYNCLRGFSVYGGKNNIFNETYYGYVSDRFSTVIPEDGRTFYAGFSYIFGIISKIFRKLNISLLFYHIK